MKKILLAFSLVAIFSCKKTIAKLEGKTRWKCHVYGYPSAPNPNDKDYNTTVCNDGSVPRFQDAYHNDVNSDCTKE